MAREVSTLERGGRSLGWPGWSADGRQTDGEGRMRLRLEKGVLYRIRAVEMPARVEIGTSARSTATAENVAASTEELVLRSSSSCVEIASALTTNR